MVGISSYVNTELECQGFDQSFLQKAYNRIGGSGHARCDFISVPLFYTR